MPELSQQLATYIDDLAAAVTPDEARARALDSTVTRRPRRPRVPVLVAALAAAACIAGAVYVYDAHRRAPTRITADADTPKVNAIPPRSAHAQRRTGAPLYLAPSYVPPGFHLVRAEGGNEPGQGSGAGGSPQVTRSQYWVQFNASHDAAVANLSIWWGGSGSTRGFPLKPTYNPSDPLKPYRGPDTAPVRLRGTEGLYSTGELVWAEPGSRIPGQITGVQCEQCTFAQIESIANHLVVRTDGGFKWVGDHGGFEFIGEEPGVASSGTNVRQITYGDGRGHGFMVAVSDDSQQPPFAQLELPGVRIIALRGTQGVIVPHLNTAGSFQADTTFIAPADHTLAWLEYPNVEVAVLDKGISETQLLDIANGLRAVGAAEWARLGGTPLQVGSAPDAATRAAITNTFVTWLDGANPNASINVIEDGESLRQFLAAAGAKKGNTTGVRGTVSNVTLLDPTTAEVTYSVLQGNNVEFPDNTGQAVKIDGEWKVTRETVCALIAPVAQCPARNG
jgi:hypothetical protein